MEKFMAKMKEYLNMDSELAFEEFSAYHQEFLTYLNTEFQSFDQDTLNRARFISSILYLNAEERAKAKGQNSKKFKKMAEKGKFWADAINYKLLKEGMTQEQIDAVYKEINEAM